MSDDQQFRYNCLELAHRMKPGSSDVLEDAKKLYGFVEGDDKTDDRYVMVDREFAEQIAAERDDVEYDPAKRTLIKREPEKAAA